MMSRYNKKGVLSTLVTLILLSTAFTAQAETMKSKYFSIDLPAGWQAPVPPKELGEGVGAAFVNDTATATVALSIGPSTQSAKELAEAGVTKAKAAGIEAGAPVEKNGLYEISFPHPTLGKGQIWFGANGKEFAMVSLVGDIEACKVLVNALKPVDPKIFPKF